MNSKITSESKPELTLSLNMSTSLFSLASTKRILSAKSKTRKLLWLKPNSRKCLSLSTKEIRKLLRTRSSRWRKPVKSLTTVLGNLLDTELYPTLSLLLSGIKCKAKKSMTENRGSKRKLRPTTEWLNYLLACKNIKTKSSLKLMIVLNKSTRV